MKTRAFVVALCLTLSAGGGVSGQTAFPDLGLDQKPRGPRGPLGCVIIRACNEGDPALQRILDNLNTMRSDNLSSEAAGTQSCWDEFDCAQSLYGWHAGVTGLVANGFIDSSIWSDGFDEVELEARAPAILACLDMEACGQAIDALVQEAQAR